TNFADQVGLTSQTASVTTIVTNEAGRPEHEVTFGNKVVKLKKPRVRINDQNFKLLQILDLLSEYDRVSEFSIENVMGLIRKYLQDSNITISELNQCLKKYPRNTWEDLLEMVFYNE